MRATATTSTGQNSRRASGVAARIRFRGTHRGGFMGIPATGRAVTFTSMEFNRVVGGRVAEHWVLIDLLGLLQQLGAAPAPHGPTA